MCEKKKRLIDADALKNSIDEHVYLVHHGFNETEYGCTQYGIHQIIDDAPTIDAEPQWIPCSERLPKIKEIVLITNDKGHVRCGQYRGVGFFSKNDGRPHWNWKGNTLETVVAWMPLPEPYEVKE